MLEPGVGPGGTGALQVSRVISDSLHLVYIVQFNICLVYIFAATYFNIAGRKIIRHFVPQIRSNHKMDNIKKKCVFNKNTFSLK